MVVDSSFVALKIATHRALRQSRCAKLRRVDLRLLPLVNPQTLHAVRQALVGGACRSLRWIAAVEALVRVRNGVVAAAYAFTFRRVLLSIVACVARIGGAVGVLMGAACRTGRVWRPCIIRLGRGSCLL